LGLEQQTSFACGALASSGYRASPALRMRIVAVGMRTILELFFFPTNYTNYAASYRWLFNQ